jgi:hypothetical protein
VKFAMEIVQIVSDPVTKSVENVVQEIISTLPQIHVIQYVLKDFSNRTVLLIYVFHVLAAEVVFLQQQIAILA